MYLALKVFSTNTFITPQPDNLSSKGLRDYRGRFSDRWPLMVCYYGILLGFTVK